MNRSRVSDISLFALVAALLLAPLRFGQAQGPTITATSDGDGISLVGSSAGPKDVGLKFVDEGGIRGSLGLASAGNAWMMGTSPGDVVLHTSAGTLWLGSGPATTTPVMSVSGKKVVIEDFWNEHRDTPSLLIRHNGDSPISPAFVLQNDGGGDIEQVFRFGSNSAPSLGPDWEGGRIGAEWHGLWIRGKTVFICGYPIAAPDKCEPGQLSVGGTITASAGLNVNGTTKTNVLEITGGSDLAESFTMTYRASIQPGMVVAIDPANPGQLRVADHAYDRTVAGIVAGANGIQPGVTLALGPTSAEQTQPVALTGRAYAWTDATHNPIRPGDLLTTADTPGHAMKVTNHARAQGAVLGKAMSALPNGKGLVLVLVSLQ